MRDECCSISIPTNIKNNFPINSKRLSIHQMNQKRDVATSISKQCVTILVHNAIRRLLFRVNQNQRYYPRLFFVIPISFRQYREKNELTSLTMARQSPANCHALITYLRRKENAEKRNLQLSKGEHGKIVNCRIIYFWHFTRSQAALRFCDIPVDRSFFSNFPGELEFFIWRNMFTS